MEQKVNEVCVCVSLIDKSIWVLLNRVSSDRPSLVSRHHHLSSEAHEEQVQIHRGDATHQEGEHSYLVVFHPLYTLLLVRADVTSSLSQPYRPFPHRNPSRANQSWRKWRWAVHKHKIYFKNASWVGSVFFHVSPCCFSSRSVLMSPTRRRPPRRS